MLKMLAFCFEVAVITKIAQPEVTNRTYRRGTHRPSFHDVRLPESANEAGLSGFYYGAQKSRYRPSQIISREHPARTAGRVMQRIQPAQFAKNVPTQVENVMDAAAGRAGLAGGQMAVR